MWNKLTEIRNISAPKAAVAVLLIVVGALMLFSLISFYLTAHRGSYVLIINFTGEPISVRHKDTATTLDGFVIAKYEVGNQTETFTAFNVDEKQFDQLTVTRLDKPTLHIWLLGQKVVVDSCLVATDVSDEFFELSPLHTKLFATAVDQPANYLKFELAKPLSYYFYPGKDLNELPRSLYSNESITAILPVSCASLGNEEEQKKNLNFWLAYQPKNQRELFSQWKSLIENDPLYNDPGPT